MIRNQPLTYCGFILLCLQPVIFGGAKAADLEIEVTNVRVEQGTLMVAVCMDETSFERRNCRYKRKLTPSSTNVSAQFSGLSPSQYAVLVWQDIDGDGALSTNFLGVPREPIGFSLNPTVRFGPPEFDEVSFEIKDRDKKLSVQLLHE